MKYKYLFTPEARADLLSIWTYVADDNLPAADRLARRLDRTFQLLARFPHKGHSRADVRTSEPVLFWPVGSYVIVYKPEPAAIVIVRVLHGARDLDALL